MLGMTVQLRLACLVEGYPGTTRNHLRLGAA